MELSDWDISEHPGLDLRNIRSLEETHTKNGYREGVIHGQEAMLQSSFNAGFSKAIHTYLELGKAKGMASAMALICYEKFGIDEDVMKETQELCSMLSSIQAKDPILLPPQERMDTLSSAVYETSSDKHVDTPNTDQVMESLIAGFCLNDSTVVNSSEGEQSQNTPPITSCRCTQESQDMVNTGHPCCTTLAAEIGQNRTMKTLDKDDVDKDSIFLGSVDIPCDLRTLKTNCNELANRIGLNCTL